MMVNKLRNVIGLVFVSIILGIAAVGCAPTATTRTMGKTVDDAVKIKNTEIVEELSLPPVKIHCSVLAEDAIKAAIKDYQSKQSALKGA